MGVIRAGNLETVGQSNAQIVDGSLKFDKNKSQRLQFTPTNSGNRRTWTISYWYKNTNFTNTGRQFQAGTSNPDFFLLGYHSLGYIQCTDWSTNWFRTGALLRDTGWYHIVLAWDSTQATNTERWKFYINGVRQNSWTDSAEHLNYPSQDSQQAVNKASVVHQLGSNTANSQYTDGHMSQVYFIDGQALDPSYFGYTDPLTNTWRPKKAKITLGSVWSNYFTDIGIIDDGALTNVFDGNTATAFEFNSTGGNGVFRPPNPISYSTSIELFSSRTLGGNTVSVNGGSTVSYGGNAWVTVASGPGTLTSLTFYNGTAGNQRIHAIRIDGNILTNTSGAIDAGANGYYLPLDGNTPIGQDRSGRGNNWTPVNFGGTNTIEKATGALPILNTDGGGKVARVGVRTDSAVGVGVTCILALPLVGIKSDFSNQVDSRSSNKAITEGGGIAGITTISNFYGGSYRFDGSDDYLSLTLGSMASTNHTIEFWMYTPDASSLMTVFEMGTGSNGDLQFILNSGAVNYGTSGSAKTSTAYVANKWYYVALVFDGTNFKTFLDGVQVSSYTQSYSISSATNLYIGRRDQNQFPFKGYLQDFRIYQGIKYTQNFIPASTDPDILPDTPSGVAYSSNVALVPSTDGAVALDGSGDYLSLASNADFDFGSGDCTVECFLFISSHSGDKTIIGTWEGNISWQLSYGVTGSNDRFGFSMYNGSTTTASSSVLSTAYVGRWVHLAGVRNGNTLQIWVNGVLDGTASFSGSHNAVNTSLIVGGRSSGNQITGFLSNVHIVKGTALYTSNFTPPTAPITSVANTKLLCCKSNSSATAFDVSPGTITANGNAVATNFNPFTVNINTQRGQESGYCTLNPLDNGGYTLSNGNLDVSTTSASWLTVKATIGVSSGKWYWEFTSPNAALGGSPYRAVDLGLAKSAATISNYVGSDANGWSYQNYDGNKFTNGSGSSYGATWIAGDVIGVVFDADNGTLTFYKNGISQGTAFTGLTSGPYFPAVSLYTGSSVSGSFNFGQKPFKFPPPAGFQPLALANTPSPSIVRPDQYVGIATWTGDDVNNRKITLNFKPDLFWAKSRSSTPYHTVNDSVRGVNAILQTNTTTGEQVNSNGYVTAFLSDGVTISNGSDINSSSYGNYVGWAWKAGGSGGGLSFWKDDVGYSTASGAGLTAGTITPTGASVNTKSGFSIITHSGSGSTGSISHGLQKAPAFIITKIRSNSVTSSWQVYHQSLGATKYITLDEGADAQTSSTRWNDTAPTSSLISLGSNTAQSYNWVIYAWAEIPGFSKFGSYIGNGSADGPVVVTGFRPAFLLIKHTNTTTGDRATIQDTNRSKYNPSNVTLSPNLANAELGSAFDVDILSNGFKIRNTNDGHNKSNVTYIYAAFAETPSFNLYGGQSNAR